MHSRYSILLAFWTACSAGSTEPLSGGASLRVGKSIVRLQLSASTHELTAGTPDTLRVTLTNDGPASVVLHFGDSCQILPYIRDATGTVVLPGEGGWACFTVLTQLALSRGQSVVREFIWTGSTSFASEMPLRPLPSGKYYVSAEVPAFEGMLRTAPLEITLHSNDP